MGVYELQPFPTPAMHWQQHHQEERLGYDPSRDLSPNLPCHDSSSSSSSSTTTTTGGPGGGVSCCSAAGPCCKEEPCQSPKPPVVCAGCNSPITDRFYLFAVDRRWHASCLQCSQCRAPLDREATCFARDGSIFCKKDYYRLFGVRRQCGRCGAGISSSELVMRAREQVYHVSCFSCAVCASLLTKGDTFGMRDGAVFCRLHYEPAPVDGGSPSPYDSQGYLPGHDYPANSQPPDLKSPPLQQGQTFYNGGPTPPRQKGRPRKRKPKDVDQITAALGDLGNDSTSYLDFGGSLSNGSGHQRTKRMRTSFKHHQLRTMKSYFAINHNPDAKDLKQLSQKTGLPKRVLQVWFQNARAKWRRMLTKQDVGGSLKDKCSEPGLDSSASFHSASPTSYLTPSPLECNS